MGNREMKPRSLSRLPFHPDLAPVQFHEFLAKMEAETSAAKSLRESRLDSSKGLEEG